jgi:hypothetical protein
MSINLHSRDDLAAKVTRPYHLLGARFDLRDIPIVYPILPPFELYHILSSMIAI